MSILTPLRKKYVSYQLRKSTQGTVWAGGRRDSATANENIDLCIIPQDPRNFVPDPQGQLPLQQIKIYREGALDQITVNSIVEYKGDDYVIFGLSDRTDNGGFSIWIGNLFVE